MGKRIEYHNPAASQVHDDLENFLDFCRNYGYRFEESELYSNKSHSWRQFQKFVSHKHVRDQWEEDAKKMA